jgi:hypothetical protein
VHKHFSSIFVSLVISLASATVPVFAAPTCDSAPYGSKCNRCFGWASYPGWSQQACTFVNNPNGPGFACSALVCKAFVKKTDIGTPVPKLP